MGSLDSINVLQYLRSKTHVDFDSLDKKQCQELGPFSDCTTNQIDSYLTLCEPEQAVTVQQSAAMARRVLPDYPGIPYEELAFEIGMCRIGLNMIPWIQGNVHIMNNPSEAYNYEYAVRNARRLYHLCRRLQPECDLSRVVIKVPATWEGLQACRTLKAENVKTLATTTFSFEQAVLAGEAGCTSVSPFIHELRTQVDDTYADEDPIFAVAVRAQRYYQAHGISTEIKACSMVMAEEPLKLAGVAAMTLPLHWLRALKNAERPEAELPGLSLLADEKMAASDEDRYSFIDDEAKYRAAFAQAEDGKAERKMKQAIEDFCEFQTKGEQLFRAADPSKTV